MAQSVYINNKNKVVQFVVADKGDGFPDGTFGTFTVSNYTVYSEKNYKICSEKN